MTSTTTLNKTEQPTPSSPKMAESHPNNETHDSLPSSSVTEPMVEYTLVEKMSDHHSRMNQDHFNNHYNNNNNNSDNSNSDTTSQSEDGVGGFVEDVKREAQPVVIITVISLLFWCLVFIIWTTHVLKWRKIKIRFHRHWAKIPILKILSLLFDFGYYLDCTLNGDSQNGECPQRLFYVTALFNAGFQMALYSLLLSLSKGYGITRTHLERRQIIRISVNIIFLGFLLFLAYVNEYFILPLIFVYVMTIGHLFGGLAMNIRRLSSEIASNPNNGENEQEETSSQLSPMIRKYILFKKIQFLVMVFVLIQAFIMVAGFFITVSWIITGMGELLFALFVFFLSFLMRIRNWNNSDNDSNQSNNDTIENDDEHNRTSLSSVSSSGSSSATRQHEKQSHDLPLISLRTSRRPIYAIVVRNPLNIPSTVSDTKENVADNVFSDRDYHDENRRWQIATEKDALRVSNKINFEYNNNNVHQV
eukprot:gb/GECH01008578.1/.p1 GENE.gb/GECH01008578.1/~~gb/GECH01008578.1/.p1  ORF type:complete len:475 (+),score=97.31 gb/GECH01008578.1/:1-1425(+)